MQALLKGNGEPAVALDPPEIWAGMLPPEEVKAFYDTLPGYSFDLDKAKAELAQSTHAERLRHLGARLDRRSLHGQHHAERRRRT